MLRRSERRHYEWPLRRCETLHLVSLGAWGGLPHSPKTQSALNQADRRRQHHEELQVSFLYPSTNPAMIPAQSLLSEEALSNHWRKVVKSRSKFTWINRRIRGLHPQQAYCPEWSGAGCHEVHERAGFALPAVHRSELKARSHISACQRESGVRPDPVRT